jgi:phospholipid-binding lipoprotein MlaA
VIDPRPPARIPRIVLAGALLLGGCATVPRDPAARAEFKAQNDPLEPLNRRMFAFNQFVDRVALKPIAQGYVKVVPRPARDALRHLLDNLNEPLVFLNNLLQVRGKGAATSAGRFLVNTVAGPVGLRDVASRNRLPPQTGDFGQTLYSWGVHDGPYLVLPLFGPSNPRDGIGMGADIYLDPFRYVPRRENQPTWESTGREVAYGIDERSRNLDSLDSMQRTSIDFYAAMRSFFRQHRATELRHGQPPPVPADLYEDPDAAPPPSPGPAAGPGVSR